MRSSHLLFIFLFWSLPTFANDRWKTAASDPKYIHRAIKQVTDVIVHDIFSPPVASRIYAYVSIAAYEAARCGYADYLSLAGQLQGLHPLPTTAAGNDYAYGLSSVHAILLVAEPMLISEGSMRNFHAKLLEEMKASGIPSDVYERSLEHGKKVAEHILAWAAQDNYKQTRSMAKYAVMNDAGSWKPTPPSYMKAVEPHWGKLRTFIIDSAGQFSPSPATHFSSDTSSAFYKEAKDVWEMGSRLTREQIDIANFWDCNPFKMNINGHVMYATKKISPGGHWINIACLAARKTNADLMKSLEAYAVLSLTLADGFISCWEEKFRSKVIRPETYINQYIDGSWQPLLQTPPFPEYTSGHSVISGAAAVVLAKFFGDHFSYSDSTEVEFQLPVRTFSSFEQAAQEAAISRFYGGIHYMPSISNGLKEGDQLGKFICMKLRTRKGDTAGTDSIKN